MSTRRDLDDTALDDELAAHLRMAVADRMARGQSREEAEAAARRELGNLAHVKEVTREQQRGGVGIWFERLGQDVRYGARALRRTPAFTTVAVLTLALAIGANTAVFTVVNSVLLRPLPLPDSERLFLASYLPERLPYEMAPTVADRSWLTYRTAQRSFEHVTAYNRAAFTLSGVGDATRIIGASVDGGFFSVVHVTPMIGRSFTAEEVRASNVVVLGEQLWRERRASYLDTTFRVSGCGSKLFFTHNLPLNFEFVALRRVQRADFYATYVRDGCLARYRDRALLTRVERSGALLGVARDLRVRVPARAPAGEPR